MTVREGADSHQGGCSIMCAVEKLAEDCPLDFSLSLYPFNMVLRVEPTLVIQQDCSLC